MGHIDLRTLAIALDGEVSGHQVLAPGPGHGRSDRSLSVKLTDVNADGFVVHSFAGDDWKDCNDHVRKRLGLPEWRPAEPEAAARAPRKAARKSPPTVEADPWCPVSPIPEGAFIPLDVALGGRAPDKTWLFKDAEGAALGFECRWTKPIGKDIRFACLCRHADGRLEWRLKHLTAPRPIYGLDRLAARPDAPVLIVEGAKKVAPAAALFPSHVVVAWPGGAEGVKNVDWMPLAGREVTIWPDHDEPGRKAAAGIAERARKAAVASVYIVPVPEAFPPKWDLADPAPEGADLAALLAAAAPAKEARSDARWPAGYKMTERGLLWSDPHDDDKAPIVVSGKFEVLAESRDDASQSWGVLLRWHDPDGRPQEWLMPRRMLAGDGTEIRGEMLSRGLYLGNGDGAKRRLMDFLAGVHVAARARVVTTTGWYGSAFVLPEGSIGRPDQDRAILQAAGTIEHAFNVRGDLAEWQEEVAHYAIGNSRLALALSAAFAAALVGPCEEESGGIHFRGPSSIGKTTALTIAGSVWGGGKSHYVRAWRATANGLEAVATSHNDALLCLDELAQLGGREAGETAYMLANGSGKARASREATLRKAAHWRLLFLSSGEISLAEKIAEDARGRRQTAGQAVRVVDVAADTKRHGLFEELHGFADAPAFAKHLTASSRRLYGTAARAFIEAVAPNLDGVRAQVKAHVRVFVAKHCPADADGQVQRVAGRFGLIAAAGEVAAAARVLPWPEGEATRAARVCLAAWIEGRGGVESSEVTEGIAAVRAFLSAHGESRFQAAWEPKPTGHSTHNLAGYRRRDGDGKDERKQDAPFDFYVTPEAWGEVCQGFDGKALAATLAARGLLKRPDNGPHLARLVRVPGQEARRLYHITARIFGDDHA